MTHTISKRGLIIGAAAGAGALAMPGIVTAQTMLRVGVAGPLTGPNAAFGEQLRRGAMMAADDINAAGGVNGARIALQFGDDRSDPREGVSVANKFVSDGVRWVIGHFNSGVSIPASDVYAENNIIQCTPASTNPRFTDRNLWNTFRTCGRDDQQGDVAGAWILANRRTARVAIVHDRTPYGKGLADFTKAAINKGGLNEALYEGIATGEKDFSALVSKMKAANVDLVYFGGLHTEAGLLIRQMRDQAVTAVMMSGDGITTKEFWTVAGAGAEGTLMTYGPDPRKNPAAAAVVAKFRAANYDPEAYTLYSYASLQSFGLAATAAGSNDPRRVATQMRNGQNLATVLGPLSWDAKGDRTSADYVMYVWRNGDYVELGARAS
jgi:branched-chain amino acid transport system substrate-binding protein